MPLSAPQTYSRIIIPSGILTLQYHGQHPQQHSGGPGITINGTPSACVYEIDLGPSSG